MDDQTLRNQLHHAVETRLSGLQGDPWLAQRVLAQAKSRAKKKKKTLCWICDCFDFIAGGHDGVCSHQPAFLF